MNETLTIRIDADLARVFDHAVDLHSTTCHGLGSVGSTDLGDQGNDAIEAFSGQTFLHWAGLVP